MQSLQHRRSNILRSWGNMSGKLVIKISRTPTDGVREVSNPRCQGTRAYHSENLYRTSFEITWKIPRTCQTAIQHVGAMGWLGRGSHPPLPTVRTRAKLQRPHPGYLRELLNSFQMDQTPEQSPPSFRNPPGELCNPLLSEALPARCLSLMIPPKWPLPSSHVRTVMTRAAPK